jgi:hypothetical protein
MAGAVRRHVTLTSEEDERLRERARQRGISEEHLITELVREALGDEQGSPTGDQRSEARREWEQVMALMHARARLLVSPEEHAKGRGWTREEIYDERHDRRAR